MKFTAKTLIETRSKFDTQPPVYLPAMKAPLIKFRNPLELVIAFRSYLDCGEASRLCSQPHVFNTTPCGFVTVLAWS